MDCFAYGLEKAVAILDDGRLPNLVKERYASFDSGEGAKFEKGELALEAVAALAKDYGSLGWTSGRQELCENILSDVVLGK
jgi:xylose isomerase